MTDQRVNIPLLRKAVEWAEAEAEKPYEQCEWMQTRYIVPAPTESDLFRSCGGDTTLLFSKAPDCGTCFCIAGKVAYDVAGNVDYNAADAIATQALGLEMGDAAELFRASNSIADVRRIAEDIAGERL